MTIVTIRGQLGSGAPEIGKHIAEILNIDYVDGEIISEVAKRLSRNIEEVERKENPPANLIERIEDALNHSPGFSGGVGNTSYNLPYWEIPINDTSYYEVLVSVIKDLSENQSLVIRGRGSQFILKNRTDAIHILVIAPVEIRLKRIMAKLNLDERTAKQEMERFDNSRRQFILRYFKAEIEASVNYDIVLNTAHFSPKNAASIIVDALMKKTGNPGG